MSSNLRFIFKNLADEAVISASPAFLSTKWVTRLQEPGRETGRTTSAAAQDITLVWPAAQKISAAGLLGHNLTVDGTLRSRLYSDAAASTLISGADTTALQAFDDAGLDDLDDLTDPDFRGYKNSMQYFAAEYTTVRAAKLSIADAANPDGYFDARRIWVGRYREARYNPPYGGLSVKPSSKTVVGDLEDGGTWSDKKGDFRTFTINLNWIDEADRAAIFAGLRYVGRHREFYISAAHAIGGVEEIYYQGVVKCVNEPDLSESGVGLISAQLQLREA